jgi:hypothetical protein
MSNMSYCRFQNTLGDLRDCLEALNNRNISSDEEKQSANILLKVMADFLVDESIIDEDGNVDYDRIEEIINECGNEED